MGRPARISREQILVEARSMLRQGGIAGLSIRQLALVLGTVPTALYNHFGSKEDLLNTVAEIALADIAFAPPASTSWLESLRQWLEATRHTFQEKPELLVLIDYAAGSPFILQTLRQLADLMQLGGIEKIESYRQAQSLLWVVAAFSMFEAEYKKPERTAHYKETYIPREHREIALIMQAANSEALWQSTIKRELQGLANL